MLRMGGKDAASIGASVSSAAPVASNGRQNEDASSWLLDSDRYEEEVEDHTERASLVRGRAAEQREAVHRRGFLQRDGLDVGLDGAARPELAAL